MEQLLLDFSPQRSSDSYSEAELALLTPDEIYALADERLLQRLSEDRRLERKPAGIHAGELGKYFSMWANTAPHGGLMVIGQEDDGHFTGCVSAGRQQLNSIESAGASHCPDAAQVSRRIPIGENGQPDDFVLLIHVKYHESRVVRDVKGKAYWRTADTKQLMLPDQVKEMEIAKGQIDLEQEPVNLNFPVDFNQQLIRRYVDAVIKHKQLTTKHSDIEILTHGRLGKVRDGEFIPNVACALLFSKDPLILFPGCKIRFLRFDGEEELTGKEYNAVKNFFIEGTIPEIIEQTEKHLNEQLREFSQLGDDGRFYTTVEYPASVWHEAIVNACVHRSYVLKNMVTFVKMFDDKLVIESPGGFPPNVSPDTIYNTHSPRNPHLMNALFYMSITKCHNEGTRRMRDSMEKSNLPKPEFAQKEVAAGFNSVRVTLRNNIKLRKLWIDSEARRALGALSGALGKNELRILNYVAEHGAINVTQAQQLFRSSNIRWQNVKKVLAGMAERKLLVHHHSKTVLRDSRAYYSLPNNIVTPEGESDRKDRRSSEGAI